MTLTEDHARGVPDFAVRQATERFVRELRQHLMRSVLASRSRTESEKRESIAMANAALDEVEEEVNDTVVDLLASFMRHV